MSTHAFHNPLPTAMLLLQPNLPIANATYFTRRQISELELAKIATWKFSCTNMVSNSNLHILSFLASCVSLQIWHLINVARS